jgi:hypothetical protein
MDARIKRASSAYFPQTSPLTICRSNYVGQESNLPGTELLMKNKEKDLDGRSARSRVRQHVLRHSLVIPTTINVP